MSIFSFDEFKQFQLLVYALENIAKEYKRANDLEEEKWSQQKHQKD